VQALSSRKTPGIWHQSVAGFKPNDVHVVAAFDIDSNKIGKDLSDSIFEAPNVSPRFTKATKTNVIVEPGIVSPEESTSNSGSRASPEDFRERLKQSGANLAILLLPSGMPKTCLAYAKACLEASCSLVNATPAALSTNRSLSTEFSHSRLVIVGDDLLSQFGGTAFHKGILEFMNRRGLKILKSYQLDVGGGNETLRTMQENVKQEKRDIKTDSISQEIPYRFETVAGTTDYVDYLGNNRTSYFWIQASTIFHSEVKIDVYLRTNDGANAANILLDVVRAAASCIRTRNPSKIQAICDYGFKNRNKPSLLQKAQQTFLKDFAVK
jgi:myo-inositol-1-phosphate synthase